MTYGLALTDGRAFNREGLEPSSLSFSNSEIDRLVRDAFNDLQVPDTMTGNFTALQIISDCEQRTIGEQHSNQLTLRPMPHCRFVPVLPELQREFCPRTNQRQDKCWGAADIYVILDTRVTRDLEKRILQANILGRVLNGMQFRRDRNAVQVFAGRTGNMLYKLPNPSYLNVTSSGCPACLAQYIDRIHSSCTSSMSAISIEYGGQLGNRSYVDRSVLQRTEAMGMTPSSMRSTRRSTRTSEGCRTSGRRRPVPRYLSSSFFPLLTSRVLTKSNFPGRLPGVAVLPAGERARG